MSKPVNLYINAQSRAFATNPSDKLGQMSAIQDPMAAGYEAALASFRSTRFPVGSDAYLLWRDGWKAAAEDVMKGKGGI